ncbi:hypothetical protein F2P56_036038 [Juglans regia]|uniref:Protein STRICTOSIDINE SYNTHASE-LIKE 10-like n=2 Tax=Juglans regia TaxID=51240 RepID=A0A2I4G181_JUGRE|nr:protein STRICTOSIDINE SYNTHASE-LIKE 10-like [Juglans regia]KAF5443484.1 hypothetical protein F2P56_036038 [Juglans regia]
MKSLVLFPASSSLLFFLLLLLNFIAPCRFMNIIPSREFPSISSTKIGDHHLENYNQVLLPSGVVGPESIAFDCQGRGPYVGVSDGRVFKWQGAQFGWTEFAISSAKRNRQICDGSTNPNTEPICGRPLGLKFSTATCDLYIADAYFGLLMVGPQGGAAEPLATSAEGVPFAFTNALDIDSKAGVVYFTDSSVLFQRREWVQILINGDRTGRLMKYDTRTKKVTVLLEGLAFPNGVALSKDNSFLLLAESGTYRILRLWLKNHTSEVFSQLERSPDNIKRNSKGIFWVALNSGRDIEGFMGYPDSDHKTSLLWAKDPVAAEMDEEGKFAHLLDGKGGKALDSVSEVEEHNGILWMGSAVKPYLGYIRL